jgi:hypothetical protein
VAAALEALADPRQIPQIPAGFRKTTKGWRAAPTLETEDIPPKLAILFFASPTLPFQTRAVIFHAMTTTHIREQIDAMSDEDRFFAAAYLQHLGNDSDEQRKAMLDSRMTRMDAGRKFSLDQLVDMHHQLESQGL